jgi:hypothetical protein
VTILNYTSSIAALPTSRNVQDFTATAAQTTFTVTNGYIVGLIDVFVNGSKLTSSEFTATNGTTFVLTVASTTGDQVQSINYTASVNGISGAGTVNELAYFTASGTIASLPVATYPSLTELSYVKGVTSAIQTQLNAKAATLSGTTNYLAKFTSSSAIGNSTLQEVSGNLGLGVTPSAWGSGFTGFQMGSLSGLSMFAYTGSNEIGSNFYYDTSYKYATTGVASVLVQSVGTFYFRNAASGSANSALTWTERMTITSAGNVGIGTSAPAYPLEISANIADWGFVMQNSNASGYGAFIKGGKSDGTTNALQVNNQAGTALLVLKGNGNVGIGNTGNASRKLEVTHPTGYSAGIRIIAETGPGDAKIQFFGGGSSQMDIGPSAASPNDLIFGAGGSERMRITSAGSLLLGSTTAPTITGGTAFLIGDTIFCSGTFNVPASYGQSLRIDIVWNNWGGNNVAAIIEVDMIAREWANLGGIAFGRVYALSSAGAATFNNTLNTTNITTANGSFSLTSPANYTLRLTFSPTNLKDVMGYLIKIPNSTGGTGTNISSITASLV